MLLEIYENVIILRKKIKKEIFLKNSLLNL